MKIILLIVGIVEFKLTFTFGLKHASLHAEHGHEAVHEIAAALNESVVEKLSLTSNE